MLKGNNTVLSQNVKACYQYSCEGNTEEAILCTSLDPTKMADASVST